MNNKIKVSFVMNCVQTVFRDWLIADYNDQVVIGDLISTYDRYDKNLNWEKYKKTRPDVVVCNNIKDTNNPLSVKNIKLTFPKAQIIVCEFWRFSGFWPNKVIKNHPSNFWYDITWDDYPCYESWINQKISPGVIDRNYKESIDKLKQMECVSDIKALDYIMDNHKDIQLFSDCWHPTEVLFKHLFQQIIAKIGLKFVQPSAMSYIFFPRYIPILNCVYDMLGLKFNSDLIWEQFAGRMFKKINVLKKHRYRHNGFNCNVSRPFSTPQEFYEWLRDSKK